MDELLRALGVYLYGPLWLVIVPWIALAGWVALTAGRRGYNQYVWFLVSLIVSPVVTVTLLALFTPRDGPHRPA